MLATSDSFVFLTRLSAAMTVRIYLVLHILY
jgi:hypothetical protein